MNTKNAPTTGTAKKTFVALEYARTLSVCLKFERCGQNINITKCVKNAPEYRKIIRIIGRIMIDVSIIKIPNCCVKEVEIKYMIDETDETMIAKMSDSRAELSLGISDKKYSYGFLIIAQIIETYLSNIY